MQLLDLTLPTPAENLALDEALLEELDTDERGGEVLRFWSPPEPLVVLGRSGKVSAEVHVENCQRMQIPILRRASGGGTVITGPGCLMYAVVLDLRQRELLKAPTQAHCYVLSHVKEAIKAAGIPASIRGTSDLAVGDRKFSGNSLRIKRNALVYHGTLLLNFDVRLISKCLNLPERQPDYRKSRPHHQFVQNLELDTETIKHHLIKRWHAYTERQDWPKTQVAYLTHQKYSRP